jgi:hypothetical protein
MDPRIRIRNINVIDPNTVINAGHTEELHDPLVQMEILQPLEQEGEPLPVVSHQASRYREPKFQALPSFSASSKKSAVEPCVWFKKVNRDGLVTRQAADPLNVKIPAARLWT